MTVNRLLPLVAAALSSFLLSLPAACGNDFRTRHSLEVEKTLGGGVSIAADYEMRTKNDASVVDSHRFTIGGMFEASEYFSFGAFYAFIGKLNSSAEMKNIHHRFYGEVTGSLPFGKWEASLREMVQYTRMTEATGAQDDPKGLVEMKSRLKLSYKGWSAVEPYFATELRNSLGRDTHLSRVRWTLGAEWSVSPHSAVEVYSHFDEVLSSGSWTPHTTLAVAYKFLF